MAIATVTSTLLATPSSRADDSDVLSSERSATHPSVQLIPDEQLDPDARLEGDQANHKSLISDAHAAARQSNRPVEIVVAKLLDQDVLSAYAGRLAQAYPEQFAGAWFDRDTFHIRFKDSVPTEAVDARPTDLRLFDVALHPDTGHSLTEAFAAQEVVTDELVRQGATGWFVAYDPADARIEVLLARDGGANRRTLMRFANETTEVPVGVTVAAQGVTVEFHVAE